MHTLRILFTDILFLFMKIKTDHLYVEHIVGSMRKSILYVGEIQFEDFVDDEEKQDAVIRKIEIRSRHIFPATTGLISLT